MPHRLYKFTGEKLVFSEGLARIQNRNGFGFINKLGEIVIPPRFQYVADRESGFQAGLCAASYRRKWGFINTEGEFAIPPIYKSANSFHEGVAAVQVSDFRMCYIDASGQRLFDSNFLLLNGGPINAHMNDFSEGLAFVFPEGDKNFRGGFIDMGGKIVINPQFTNDFAHFQDGFALVGIKGDWFVIKRDGERLKSNWRISPGLTFYNGVSFFRSGIKIRLIDVTGEFVSDNKFDCQLSCFSEGLALVGSHGGNHKFIDTTGQVILENNTVNYEGEFCNGLALVKSNKEYGYINHNGDFIIEPQFSHAYRFTDGVAQVELNGKWGLIDITGNQIAGF